ncbi:hypothetical protein CCM_03266 [Cordyceps militaris CM01]|uniref:Altered inheritance of mitochondria protein 11 n=1 Tax=Cordyceps militaris (strain CM01) TaxID=983644 RepID=G3J9S1_CORMM|nr:uncharacterized protein CCM_03266 [Cordyceps militaris CM01]EGX94994.1 hypothetical protein CCM_03266 [Cordyceps militaris CM01]
MGFLAKLLAPHVVGPSEPASPAPAASSSPASVPAPPQPLPYTAPAIDTSRTAHLTPLQRQAKQLSLLVLGAGFMAASVAVTRRAVVRRQLEAVPRFFHSSYVAAGSVDSAARSSLAAQALGLATLNVAAFGVLLVAGTAWSFDLCSVAELQARTQMVVQRRGAGGVLAPEEEREVDNMVASFMERLGMDVEELREKDRRAAEGVEENAQGVEDRGTG